jgi:integrase
VARLPWLIADTPGMYRQNLVSIHERPARYWSISWRVASPEGSGKPRRRYERRRSEGAAKRRAAELGGAEHTSEVTVTCIQAKPAWVVRWRDPRPREKTFRRKADAERYERAVRHQVDAGTYRDPSLAKITFRRWYDRWWPTIESSDRAPNTIANYEAILQHHVLPYLGGRRLGDLRRIHFEEWLTELRHPHSHVLPDGKRCKHGALSASALHKARTTAGMVLASAVDNGLIPANPIAGLRLVKGTSKTEQALTVNQVDALAKAVGAWWRPLVLLLGYCGLRPSEAAALRRRNLDDLGRLTIDAGATEHRGRLIEADTKTRRARVIQVPPSVLIELRRHIERHVPNDPEAPIFTTPAGERFRLSNWRHRVWDPAAIKANLPTWATPYALRHTAASLLAQQGVPATVAAAMLGHDPAIFLRTYAHLYPGDLAAAADAIEEARRTSQKAPKRLDGGKAAAGISRGRRSAPGGVSGKRTV